MPERERARERWVERGLILLWREATFHLLVEQFMNETLAESVAVVVVFRFCFRLLLLRREEGEDREGYRDIGYGRQRHLFCV